MFQTRCSRGVELLSFQKLLRKSRDSREKEGMYSEKHHRLHLVEETFWIKNCWKLHMRSTPKQCIGLSFSYLFVPQVSGFGTVINGLLMQCSCCYMGFCSSSGLPTSHFSSSVPILIRIIQGIISPETLQVNMYVIFAYENNPFLSA